MSEDLPNKKALLPLKIAFGYFWGNEPLPPDNQLMDWINVGLYGYKLPAVAIGHKKYTNYRISLEALEEWLDAVTEAAKQEAASRPDGPTHYEKYSRGRKREAIARSKAKELEDRVRAVQNQIDAL